MGLTTEKYWARKKAVIEKYNYRCAYCGCEITLRGFEIDHIVPKLLCRQHLGRIPKEFDELVNLNPACSSCNNYKRAHSLETFRSEIEKQIFRLRRDIPTFRLAERYGLINCTEKDVTFYFETLQSNGRNGNG